LAAASAVSATVFVDTFFPDTATGVASTRPAATPGRAPAAKSADAAPLLVPEGFPIKVSESGRMASELCPAPAAIAAAASFAANPPPRPSAIPLVAFAAVSPVSALIPAAALDDAAAPSGRAPPLLIVAALGSVAAPAAALPPAAACCFETTTGSPAIGISTPSTGTAITSLPALPTVSDPLSSELFCAEEIASCWSSFSVTPALSLVA
jgi:hypothetical protein